LELAVDLQNGHLAIAALDSPGFEQPEGLPQLTEEILIKMFANMQAHGMM